MVSMAEEDRLGQRDWGGDTAALGGYGSAGLYSRRRQMERTTGGSFLNISDAPRAGGTGMGGGYVSMPTVGPRPEETTPLVSGHTGPSGPTAMAQGVRGSYAASPPDVPKFGQMAETLSRAGGAIAGAIGVGVGAYRNRPRKEAEPEEQKALPSGGRPMGTGEEDPRALSAGEQPAGALPRGGRNRRRNQVAVPDRTPPKWDPTLTAPTVPQQSPVMELTTGTPATESQWREEGLGRNQYASDDITTQRRVVSPETGRSATVTSPIVAQTATSYEHPTYNPRLGAKLGRTATRGERTATRDPNQMGLFDPNA